MMDIDNFRDLHPDFAPSLATESIDLSSDSVVRLKETALPRSIVSIDVGIRNLAWVELSSRGEILRWSVDDLLGGDESETESVVVGQVDLSDAAPTETTHEKTIAKKKAKLSKKVLAPQYDPRLVALRLDQIMQTIFNSEQIEGVIVERQRFRTGGMHAVLDATFKCGVVEGMIHTWLAIWEKGRLPGILDNKRKDVTIESISPRAVGTWWSIGSGTRSSGDDSSTEASMGSASEVETIAKYATKKKQSRAIVDGWIQQLEDKEESKTRTRDINHPFRVSCSPDIREWYRLERKRDDLSDCLLQAVAWYEWREHAMNEALRRYPLPDFHVKV
ncbi:hypothetical protein BGZ59_009855 [Podila verticillata]|nr:hypothetical protein BGZ59_009855 [Podila verticillata]KFH73518.1 hypothetical protein MVEG_00734 [Podila verticillata NRRL 6337]